MSALILCIMIIYFTDVVICRPNVLFIMADDLGWNDVSWNNPTMPTPNLHKLATEGVILNQSYVNQVCSPWHLGYCNVSYIPTGRGFDHFYGLYMGKQDYYTHHYYYKVGKFRMDGLDLWDMLKPAFSKEGTYSTELYATKAVEVIENYRTTQPFFMYLAFNAPHYPLQVPVHYLKPCLQYKNKKRRLYCGMVNALDYGVGSVVDALKKTGQYNNTIIIFNSDNGGEVRYGGNNFPLRGGKHTLWEGGNRAVSFVHAPAFIPKPGVRHKQIFTVVDWLPTILAAAGLKIKKYGDGVNQWEMIRNDAPGLRHSYVYNIYGKNAAIRRGRYKLIVGNPGKPNGWVPEPTLKTGNKPINVKEKGPWLFHLKKDPTERINLAKKYPGTVKKMMKIIRKLKKEVVPSVHRKIDKKGDPRLYNGTFATGWCK